MVFSLNIFPNDLPWVEFSNLLGMVLVEDLSSLGISCCFNLFVSLFKLSNLCLIIFDLFHEFFANLYTGTKHGNIYTNLTRCLESNDMIRYLLVSGGWEQFKEFKHLRFEWFNSFEHGLCLLLHERELSGCCSHSVDVIIQVVSEPIEFEFTWLSDTIFEAIIVVLLSILTHDWFLSEFEKGSITVQFSLITTRESPTPKSVGLNNGRIL